MDFPSRSLPILLILSICINVTYSQDISRLLGTDDLMRKYNDLNEQHEYPWAQETLGANTDAAQNEMPIESAMSIVNMAKNKDYQRQLELRGKEIENYGSQYMNYLQQQHEYQEQVLKEKMRAMSLLQQQSYTDQVKKLRAAYELQEHSAPLDNTNGGRILTEPSETNEPVTPRRYHPSIHDENGMRDYLQKRFGIDVENDESTDLIASVRQFLKEHKNEVMKKGIYTVMENYEYKERNLHQQTPRPLKGKGCLQCISAELSTLEGEWTMVLGVSSEFKTTVKTIGSLLQKETLRDAVCAGMIVNAKEQFVQFSFNEVDGTPIKINGTITESSEGFIMETDMLFKKECVVDFDSSTNPLYIVLASVDDHSCRSLSVWTKMPATFFTHYFKQIDKMMKKLSSFDLLPLSPIPFPKRCLPEN